MEPKVDFFIIGAPKCGTTALSRYLADHPGIYFPPRKELHYFAEDMTDLRIATTLEEYRAYFKDAPHGALLGEGSTWYLFSDTAVQVILERLPDARFIVCVRNPVEMAPSLHSELLFRQREDQPDFETAWRLQDERRNRRALPAGLKATRMVQYGEVCSLGAQLERALGRIGRQRLQIVFAEDLRNDPRLTYLRVLEFLGVPDDGRRSFPRVNENKVGRFPALRRLLFSPPAVLRPIMHGARRSIEGLTGRSVSSMVQWVYTKHEQRPPMPTSLRNELLAYFDHDMSLLERLTGRNLEHWRFPDNRRVEAQGTADEPSPRITHG